MNKTNQDNQQGFVAIFSVLIIMGILTLLMVGFSGVVRDAQRRSLDDQLSTQAFYAAESAVGQILALGNALGDEKTDCLGGSAALSYDVDTARGLAISCLLYDRTPESIDYDFIPVAGEDEPVTMLVASHDASIIDTFTVEWESIVDANGAINSGLVNGSPMLPNRATWAQNIGMLRIDMIPGSISASDKQAQVNGMYSVFLYPSSSPTETENPLVTVSPGVAAQGQTIVARCTSPGEYKCSARIRPSGGTDVYYYRVQAYYNPVRISLSATTSASVPIQFRDAQTLVDVTGRANDVYRRIQMRIPRQGESSFDHGWHSPEALLSADSICKRILAGPTSTEDLTGIPAAQQASCRIVP